MAPPTVEARTLEVLEVLSTVISCLLLWVTQDGVCLSDLLEFLLLLFATFLRRVRVPVCNGIGIFARVCMLCMSVSDCTVIPKLRAETLVLSKHAKLF